MLRQHALRIAQQYVQDVSVFSATLFRAYSADTMVHVARATHFRATQVSGDVVSHDAVTARGEGAFERI